MPRMLEASITTTSSGMCRPPSLTSQTGEAAMPPGAPPGCPSSGPSVLPRRGLAVQGSARGEFAELVLRSNFTSRWVSTS
eukprot:8397714-Pyramimonas_sp.AAC.1